MPKIRRTQPSRGVQQERWAEAVKGRLRDAWETRGFSQGSFARAIGRSTSAVSLMMSRGSLDDWWNLVTISRVLDTSLDSILGVDPGTPMSPLTGRDGLENVISVLREAVEGAELLQKRMQRVAARQSGASRKK